MSDKENPRKLSIKWSYDENLCDICGMQYSNGCVVTLDDKVILDDPACASCFGAPDLDSGDVLQALCAHLGITIEEEFEEWEKVND